MGAVGVQVAVEDWLHQGRSAKQSRAVTGWMVLRSSAMHSAPLGDQPGQLVGVEALQPRPQADVGRVGGLGLHADQLLDLIGSRELPAAQQLPLREATFE